MIISPPPQGATPSGPGAGGRSKERFEKAIARGENLVHRHPRVQFQYEQMMRANVTSEPPKIDRSRSDRLMISPRRVNIVQVKTGKAVREGLQQGVGIEETEPTLDLGVTGIMPIGNLVRAEPFHKRREPLVGRQLEQPLTILHRKTNPGRGGFREETPEVPLDPGQRRTGFLRESLERPRVRSALLRPALERLCRRSETEKDAARVQHDMGSTDSSGELKGLQGVPHPGTALDPPTGRRLVEIGSGPVNPAGQRAKIVNARDIDNSFIDGAQDPRHQ